MSIFSFDYEGRKVLIENGKEAYISSIHQTGTYNGCMCGYPNKNVNVHILESARKWAEKLCGGAVYLMPPAEKPMKRETVSLEELLGLVNGIEIAEPAPLEVSSEPVPMIAFSAVMCCATLMYDGVFRDTSKGYSFLHILWFQDDYAFPIDADILEKIKQIPFAELCIECDY